MNITIKNENLNVMNALSIEVIKELQGTYSRQTIESELTNLYFNKAVIDITSVANFNDDNSLFSLLDYFGPDKVILVLNDNPNCNSPLFLRKLVEKGYYNFTKNSSGVSYLINRPNTLEDVKKYAQTTTFTSEINNPVQSNNSFINNSGTMPANEQVENKPIETKKVKANARQRIIGIENLTPHAGATTLMNLMVRQLSYSYKVKGIEMNFQDSMYFRNDNIVYCSNPEDLQIRIKNLYNEDAIIIDLNNRDGAEFCDEVIYLVEPGIIRLSKLIKRGINLSEYNKKGKIVLNRSNIKNDALATFEYEVKFKVFFNMPNFDDRKDRIQIVDSLLVKLGFEKQRVGGMFSVFK